MASYSTAAVAFGDLKNTALYFDYVIPVFLAAEVVRDESEVKSLTGRRHDLLPPNLLSRRGFAERLVAVNEATFRFMCKLGIQRFGLKPKIAGVSDEQYLAIEDNAAALYFSFIDEYDLKEYPLASAKGPTSAWMDDEDDYEGSPVVTLADLKLVDASRVTWRQLIEFRKDEEGRRRLRRLRLFACETYSGRDRSYIEDDILTRVAEYDDTVRQWGFDTITGALSLALNSKLTASVVAGGYLTTLFGQPATALLAGAVIELGHIAVEIGRQRFALSKLVRDNPVSFVSYARKQVNKSEER